MKTLALTLYILSLQTIWAQSYRCMVKTKEGWGYVNEKGQSVIKPRFNKSYSFSNGLALVQMAPDGPYSFLKPDGSRLNTIINNYSLIDYAFEVVGFCDGRAAIKSGDKWGFMNTEGKLATAILFDKVSEWAEGAAAVKLNNDWIIIDEAGNQFPVQAKKVKSIKHFSEGLAPFVGSNGQSGFINRKGEVVIEAKFENTSYFVDGLAWARASNDRLGYIDKTGIWVITPDILETKDFDPVSKMARIKRESGWMYIDEVGKPLKIALEVYDDFSEGLCGGRTNGLWGFFDKNGTWVIKPQFDGIREFKNGYAAAKTGGSWGIIDTSGNWVIKPIFDSIKDMEKVD